MQTAKKLVLLDEFDREYKRLQRPATAVAKTDHSLRLSNNLRNDSLTDDRKVREYVGTLHRYLNVSNRAPVEESTTKINWSTEPKKKKKKKTTSTGRQGGRTIQWDQY